jgi:putative hydrolase of HD superfamily
MRDELKEILGLKNVLRAGWVRAGIESPESVAAHSWGMSMLALKLAPKELDLSRVLSLCIVHDIPEVRVGDLTPHDDTSTKAEDELNAMKEMAPEWVGLFEEYEQGKTPEAKFVKQLDKLDMALQAEIYQSKFDIPLTEFIESARLRIDDEVLKNLLS